MFYALSTGPLQKWLSRETKEELMRAVQENLELDPTRTWYLTEQFGTATAKVTVEVK